MVAILKTTQIQEPSSATVNLTLDTSGGVTVGQNLTSPVIIPTSSSAPSNGLFLPAANAVGLATNSVERARIDSSGYMQGTVNGLSAGRIPAMQYFRINSDLAGANVSTAQSVFGVGVTLVGSTVYAFESTVLLSKTAGATSHTIGMGFGGTATVNNIIYYLSSQDQSAVGVGTAGAATTGVFLSTISSASNTTFTQAIATATRVVPYTLRGTVSINAGGTFIPQYTLSAAPGGAYSTVAGSYFAIYPLAASGSNVNIGSWA
jgi:hypothetical protein